jgi:hypothetical protein
MKLCRVYDAGSTRKHPDHCKCGAPVAWHHPRPNCANDPAPHFLIGNLPLRSSREISLFGQATAVLPSAFWRHLKFRVGRRHRPIRATFRRFFPWRFPDPSPSVRECLSPAGVWKPSQARTFG